MRILIIEDEPRLLHNLSRSLREEQYAVDTAANGEEGLYKAQTCSYDLVVLDIMLPGISGWDVLQELRKTRNTPVLALTSKDTARDRVKGLDSGADDYLVKPFDLTELLARIRALIRRAAGQSHPRFDLGDIQVDTRSKSVILAGKPIPMTAREYSILEYLLLHRGEVISRSILYEHILDESDDTLSNLVDVHVFSIHKKLGRDLISTRRGQGYCID